MSKGAGELTRYEYQDAKAIHNKRGYIELSTQKGGTFFTTKDLKELSSDYADITKEYARKQSDLVKEVLSIACESCFTTFSSYAG